MASRITLLLLLALAVVTVDCNSEVDALNAWKVKLVDPNNVLQSWDPTEINPCTWLHVTCNNNNSVVRVDLGNAGLSGPLVPQLGSLANLQYLMVHGNSISGTIPVALGNLTRLLILGLQHNQLTGPIPASLGKLVSLRFMRLNSNKLTGRIPTSIITLINLGNMNVMNVSDNSLVGRVRTHDSKGFAVTTIIQDPKTPPK